MKLLKPELPHTATILPECILAKWSLQEKEMRGVMENYSNRNRRHTLSLQERLFV
jgi:hypothetical protein